MRSNTFDALVIGGGPSGGTAALLLARAGWSVALVEKMTYPRQKVCGEFLSATNLPLVVQLGLAEVFLAHAGPPVTRVGLYAGDQTIVSDMPQLGRHDLATGTWSMSGRALGRDRLDTILLERAAAAGVQIWQPCSVVSVARSDAEYVCRVVPRARRHEHTDLRARIVVAAHGSWEAGPLATQSMATTAPRDSDLFGFKGHFLDTQLPTDLMPLLIFPGGYGGMVHSDGGRVSLSCCIRRDDLVRVRRAAGGMQAGAAVGAHIARSCRGVRDALVGARLEHGWVSAGPIRPGIRQCAHDGVFLVGNAAGEAHPAVAEGIGMAMQSAWRLCESLTAVGRDVRSTRGLDAARADYALAWRRAIAPRIRAAGLIAQWAMSPAAVQCAMPMLRMFPAVLTAGARLSGKSIAPEPATR